MSVHCEKEKDREGRGELYCSIEQVRRKTEEERGRHARGGRSKEEGGGERAGPHTSLCVCVVLLLLRFPPCYRPPFVRLLALASLFLSSPLFSMPTSSLQTASEAAAHTLRNLRSTLPKAPSISQALKSPLLPPFPLSVFLSRSSLCPPTDRSSSLCLAPLCGGRRPSIVQPLFLPPFLNG